MIVALFGLPGVGKTTLSNLIKNNSYINKKCQVVIRKLSYYVESEQGRKCTLEEINNFYKSKLEEEGPSYWATRIINDSQDKILIIDGVWFTNELLYFSNSQFCHFIGVYLEEEKSILYERACETTIRKNEDIFELKRVMDIIKSFDFSKFMQYATIRGHCDTQIYNNLQNLIIQNC